MTYAGVRTINVSINFPNQDPTQRPTVSNDCSEDDVVDATATGVEWVVGSNLPPGSDDNLTLTGVTFYRSSAKTTVYNPPFLNTPGGPDTSVQTPRLTWLITFNDTEVSATTDLTYDLHFSDDLNPNMDWDPTLTINMRTASEAGAGA
jgi:hypothetical protein